MIYRISTIVNIFVQETIVLRGGKKNPLPVNQLVVGDIVDVKFGDRAPADIRVIRSAGLKVNSHPCITHKSCACGYHETPMHIIIVL